MLVINPDDCIDCALCEPVCPENAIYADTEIPEVEQLSLELNARLSLQWPPIYKSKPPMPDAEKWKGVANKWALLQEEAGEIEDTQSAPQHTMLGKQVAES